MMDAKKAKILRIKGKKNGLIRGEMQFPPGKAKLESTINKGGQNK